MRPALLAGLLLVTGACAEALGPAEASLDQLHLRASLSPATVAAGDSLTLVVSIENTGDTDVVVSFGMGCPYYLNAFRRVGSRRIAVPLDGTRYGCIAVGRGENIPANQAVEYRSRLAAAAYGTPVPSGTYVLVVDWTGALPDLNVPFQVSP